MSIQTSPKINEAIGRRLRLIRKSKGWSLREAARRLGSTYNKLFSLESGKTTLGIDDLFLRAEKLGISPLEILQDLLTADDLRALGRALLVERDERRIEVARAMRRLEVIGAQNDVIEQMLADNCGAELPLEAQTLVDAAAESRAMFWLGAMQKEGRTVDQVAADWHALGDLGDTLDELFAWLFDEYEIGYSDGSENRAVGLSALMRRALENARRRDETPLNDDLARLAVYGEFSLAPEPVARLLVAWCVHQFLVDWRESTGAAGLGIRSAAGLMEQNAPALQSWIACWIKWALTRGHCQLGGPAREADLRDSLAALESVVAGQIADWPDFFDLRADE